MILLNQALAVEVLKVLEVVVAATRHEHAELTAEGDPEQFSKYVGMSEVLVSAVVLYVLQNALALELNRES
jgi:hypothetical protein